jgi:hypothetical protein
MLPRALEVQIRVVTIDQSACEKVSSALGERSIRASAEQHVLAQIDG